MEMIYHSVISCKIGTNDYESFSKKENIKDVKPYILLREILIALKSTRNKKEKVMFISETEYSIDWYAKNIGLVKSETITKKGKSYQPPFYMP